MLLKALWCLVGAKGRRASSVDSRLFGAPLMSLREFQLRFAAWFTGHILLALAWVGVAVFAVRYWDASLWVKAPLYTLLFVFAPVGQPRYRSYEHYRRAWLVANNETAAGGYVSNTSDSFA